MRRKGRRKKRTLFTTNCVISAISQWKLKCCLIPFWRIPCENWNEKKNYSFIFTSVLKYQTYRHRFCMPSINGNICCCWRGANLSCNITRTHHKLPKNFSSTCICWEEDFFSLFQRRMKWICVCARCACAYFFHINFYTKKKQCLRLDRRERCCWFSIKQNYSNSGICFFFGMECAGTWRAALVRNFHFSMVCAKC